MKSLADRFWEKVVFTEGGCWPWGGGVACKKRGEPRSRGRGILFVSKKPKPLTILAAKVSFELHKGQVPEGLCVCHSCDEPLCVNPAHLFLGTSGDNSKDMGRKGRHPGRRKISPDQAREILESKEPARALSARYRLTESMIYRIKRRTSWCRSTTPTPFLSSVRQPYCG